MSEPLLRARADREAPLSRRALGLEFCRFLEERGVAYALLGDPTALAPGAPEADAPGDVDIAIDPVWFGRLAALVRGFCDAGRLALVQILQHEWSALFFVIAWRGERGGALEVAHLDLYGEYVRKARRLLGGRELLARRVRSGTSGTGPFVPAPDVLFAAYLLKKVDKRALGPRHLEFLRSLWDADPPGCRAQLERFWGAPSAERLSRGLAREPDALRRELPALARELWRGQRATPGERLRELGRRIRRVLRPTGYWVVLLGPDGAGKSALTERLGQVLEPVFRRVCTHHLRPHLLGRAGPGGPVTEPHAQVPRGRAASVAKLALWWLDATLGFAAVIWPSLVRSGLVLFDRHVLDLAVDPLRYRYRGSVRAAEWLLRRTFQPAFFAVLEAPTELLHRRKREVAAAEVDRQREAYRELARRLPDAVRIDASRELDAVCADVADRILERLARRTARRCGLPAPDAAPRADARR